MFRCASVAVVLLASSAPALGFCWRTAYYPAYYPAPVPVRVVYYAPVHVAPLPCPVPGVMVPRGPVYAVPTPAPPSGSTTEPPLKAGPKVTEQRSFYGTAPAAYTKDAAADSTSCRVGFWNVSGRDVTVTVDGQPRLLPRDRAVTLTLSRQFTWQVDGRPAQTERVPAGRASAEIVIRP